MNEEQINALIEDVCRVYREHGITTEDASDEMLRPDLRDLHREYTHHLVKCEQYEQKRRPTTN